MLRSTEVENGVIVIINDLMNDGSLNSKDEIERKIHSSQFFIIYGAFPPKT